MKLRIRGNTLRLRLSRSEVERIGHSEAVEERTDFPGGSVFRYALVPDADAPGLKAAFDRHGIVVRLPATLATNWAGGDDVGIRATQPLDGGAELGLLIEKDFACLKPRDGEDESDMFDHPDPGRC